MLYTPINSITAAAAIADSLNKCLRDLTPAAGFVTALSAAL